MTRWRAYDKRDLGTGIDVKRCHVLKNENK